LSPIKEDTKFWHHLTGFSIAYYFAVYASVLFQCSPLGQLFKCKLIGFWLSDWIKSWQWVVQKGKKESEIRLDQGIQS